MGVKKFIFILIILILIINFTITVYSLNPNLIIKKSESSNTLNIKNINIQKISDLKITDKKPLHTDYNSTISTVTNLLNEIKILPIENKSEVSFSTFPLPENPYKKNIDKPSLQKGNSCSKIGNLFKADFSIFPNIEEIPDEETVKDRRINKSINKQIKGEELEDNRSIEQFITKFKKENEEKIKEDKLRVKVNITQIKSELKKPTFINKIELNKNDFLKELEKDTEFNDINNYATELGYINLNRSEKFIYDQGIEVIITPLTSIKDVNTTIFLVKAFKEGKTPKDSRSFLIKIEKENNFTYLTMFDRTGGVKGNLLNGSIVSEWGHHSCSGWTCIWDCTIYNVYLAWWGYLCLGACETCAGLPNPVTCAGCVTCGIAFGVTCGIDCANDPCSWYPCQADCDDYDSYSSNWNYYCVGNEKWKRILYYDYYCPDSSAYGEGSCELLSANYVDNSYVQTCPYGCSNGNCLGAVTCYSDLECGTDGWVGNPYCSGGNVKQYYRTYDCHYSGTENSYCTYSQEAKLKQECTSGSCNSGVCVGDVYCEEQYPQAPYYCNGACIGCSDNNIYNVCCPSSGDPQYCCLKSGPYCDTSTGTCTLCGGNYPDECNNACWPTPPSGYELCCPTSGDPQYWCNSELSMCMPNGDCCAPSVETCNNVDDDCNGVIDSFNEGCGVGKCAGGTRTCTAGSWGSCSTNSLATNETCNNIDDDCDGNKDEDLSQECGTDVGACVKGTQACSAGSWGECGGSYVGSANETCNNVDDNCNNLIDEGGVCGDYPNITLEYPSNNEIFYNGNITFNCSITDDSGLANVTLYHDINGNFTANETKSISGTNDKATFIINNIPIGHYKWNCLAYDNDSHWSLGQEAYSFTISEEGLITTFADGTFEKSLEYDQPKNQTIYIKIPKGATVLNASATITGYLRSMTEHFYWINWTSLTTNFDGGVAAYEMAQTPDSPPSGVRMINVTYPSKYNGTFTLGTTPENVTLKITHLTSSGPPSYSPVTITVNGEIVAYCFDPGSLGYITHEWDITQYAQQGTNVIESVFCANASTHYWIQRNEINSSFEIFPTNPIVFVNVSSTDQPKIWNYSGEFSGPENITAFEDELNNALSNCIEDTAGYCNISLILYSGSIGELKLTNLEIYYKFADELPNVNLISPENNNVSTIGNVTFNCSASDDYNLASIVLYANVGGTWKANQTNYVTGTYNSTTFIIDNIPDDTNFVWNCLAYDNASQSAFASTNYSVNISLTNTAPTIVDLTQIPNSLYRGEDIEIRCAVNDAETTNSSLNVNTQYQNITNNGYLNCSDIIYDSVNLWWKCNYTTNYSDNDLGTFDFRCQASDNKSSSGWTTDNDTITVLNNYPNIYACEDGKTYLNSSGSAIQIDLTECSSDLEDSDSSLVYQINNETNTTLIDCYIAGGTNITCNNPATNQYGVSEITVQVNDTDSGINTTTLLITVWPWQNEFYSILGYGSGIGSSSNYNISFNLLSQPIGNASSANYNGGLGYVQYSRI